MTEWKPILSPVTHEYVTAFPMYDYRLLMHRINPAAHFRDGTTRELMIETWETPGIGVPDQSVFDAENATLQAEIAAKAADKLSRQTAHDTQHASHKATLQGLDPTKLNGAQQTAAIAFLLSELGYVKMDANDKPIIDIPNGT